MRSMTGFGRAELDQRGVRVSAEVKTLNQRFFDLKLNSPRGWGEYEGEMRRLVQNFVARGRVEVFVRCALLGPPRMTLRVNEALAKSYVTELKRLGGRLGLDGLVRLDALLGRPEIFQVVEEEGEAGAGVALGLKALVRALKAMDLDRRREGSALRRDLAVRIAKIAKALPRISRLANQSRAAIIASYQNRVRELLEELPVDERRLYEEAAGAAQRADISEELARLKAHLVAMRELLARKEPAGKAIDFLLQEINREVNTMGAKSQSAALSRLTVELKSEVEKMREQVQNVE